MCPHIVTAPSSIIDSIFNHNLNLWPGQPCMPQHFADDRPTKQLKGHSSRYRVPGQAEQRNTIDLPKGHWFARSHIDAPEIDLSLLLHNLFNKIKLTHRD